MHKFDPHNSKSFVLYKKSDWINFYIKFLTRSFFQFYVSNMKKIDVNMIHPKEI